MKFATYNTPSRAFKKAGAAVYFRGGFTMLELMVVIVILGILATLAYSSLMDIIFINRAKETAQTIRTFTERALADAKRQNKKVRICIKNNAIISEDPTADGCGNGTKIASEALLQGFSVSSSSPVTGVTKNFGTDGAEAQIRIGLSGITEPGYFAACGAKGYCGGAVKLTNENSLKAYIKKGTSASWEAL